MPKDRKAHLRYLLIILAVALAGYGALGLWQRWQASRPNAVEPNSAITHSTDKPSEAKPNNTCDDYRGSNKDQPFKIELPDIDVSGCVQKVGVDQNNSIAVPDNVHVAGWYVGSALPGNQGVSIVSGHASGRYTQGIFKNLSKLSVGNIVRVQFAGGDWREFEVKSINEYSPQQTTKEQYKQLDGVSEQLNLITCGGQFSEDTQQFNKRVLVRTALVK